MKIRQTTEYQILAKKMDARDSFYSKLKVFYDAHGSVPSIYQVDFDTYLKDQRPWRTIPGIEARVIKAAKRMIKNV